MADAFHRYEPLKKTSPDEDSVVLATLASADAVVAAIDDLRKQVVKSGEELDELIYDLINNIDDFDDDDDFFDDETLDS